MDIEILPLAQAVQEDPLRRYPAWQSHVLAPATDMELAAHSRHPVAPVALMYLPAAQSWQYIAAGAPEYFPGEHPLQPSSHHDLDLPAAHAVHPTCPSPSYPASHLHASWLLLPCHVALAPHSRHAVAPVVYVYVPFQHSSQSDPAEAEYLPAGHASHVPPVPDEDAIHSTLTNAYSVAPWQVKAPTS